MTDHLEEVRRIVGEVLDVDPGTLSSESSKETLEQWDSIAHLNIIMSLEASYDIEIDLSNALELTSVEGIVGYLNNQPAGA